MIPLYLYLLIGSLFVPLLFTVFFHDYIKYWKSFAVSTTIIAVIFLIWDAIFTYKGVWEFNNNYCLDYTFFSMPIEEWLFFFIIPFCSLFIHFSVTLTYPKLILNKKTTLAISLGFILIISIILIAHLPKLYTTVNFGFLLITLIISLGFYLELLQKFLVTFLIILIPFFIVNGVLTGAITQAPVVSYNDLENLGIRIITIPIEDFGYAFTMLLGNLMIFETIKSKLN